ncbi:MAG: hypothetical protein HZB13_15400, partial [Acidobacteria bacterium]|nr:hypothetical protein [Acidobacteriota bacterium]
CDLKVGAETFPGINTWRANWIVWQRHGFERPAWDNAVQFKRTILDRNHFPKDSGFTATFRFSIDTPQPPAAIDLAVETPELYRISVNGKPADFSKAARYNDPRLLRASIASLVKTGENVVQLEASPFDVHMELENIFILCPLAVEPAAKGFRLTSPKSPALGSWAANGWPFYSESATYTASVAVPAPATRLKLDLTRWNGSLAIVTLDGKQTLKLGWPPYTAEFTVAPGQHEVAVQVVGTPRNLFGPFHHPAKLRMRAWPAAWAEFPESQPPGASYDILDYGLLQPPAISIGGVTQ